ncbi:MAG: phage portal protein [Planctomycetota bacterium]|nr:phage portal protein [Planctomycetota bacterium]
MHTRFEYPRLAADALAGDADATSSAVTHPIDDRVVLEAIARHQRRVAPRIHKLWLYYRNDLAETRSTRGWYRQAQEAGLPPRVTGAPAFDSPFDLGVRSENSIVLDDRARGRREVVVENDIAWRIHAMVDFMFGKPVRVMSTARDERLRQRIEQILDAAWEASGGIALLQDAALLGHVFGYVDFLVRVDPAIASLPGDAPAATLARAVRIEVVDPLRGTPILDPDDYRVIRAFATHDEREALELDAEHPGRRRRINVTEILADGWRRVFEDGRLIERSPLRLPAGETGVVHVQNIAQPFRYEGLSEVEPLIPLQDELNTRLSDRAHRISMQCFKMYLAKGIDGFGVTPVGPGQVWSTDNEDASIEAFGGDANSPTEEQHILEIREAIDKVSGVPPIASGVVRAKIGNLSSANALRITLMGVLSKTARKRVSYGRGMAGVCRLILGALDIAGVLKTGEDDRGVRFDWPDPLPDDLREKVATAEARVRLGVPPERIAQELGFAPTDPGIQ